MWFLVLSLILQWTGWWICSALTPLLTRLHVQFDTWNMYTFVSVPSKLCDSTKEVYLHEISPVLQNVVHSKYWCACSHNLNKDKHQESNKNSLKHICVDLLLCTALFFKSCASFKSTLSCTCIWLNLEINPNVFFTSRVASSSQLWEPEAAAVELPFALPPVSTCFWLQLPERQEQRTKRTAYNLLNNFNEALFYGAVEGRCVTLLFFISHSVLSEDHRL